MKIKLLLINLNNQSEIEKGERILEEYLKKGYAIMDTFDGYEASILFYLMSAME